MIRVYGASVFDKAKELFARHGPSARYLILFGIAAAGHRYVFDISAIE